MHNQESEPGLATLVLLGLVKRSIARFLYTVSMKTPIYPCSSQIQMIAGPVSYPEFRVAAEYLSNFVLYASQASREQ